MAADYREQAANDPSKLLSAPVIIKSTVKNEQPIVANVVVEEKPQAENALMIIRDELKRLQDLEQEKHAKDGQLLSTTKRFTPESMTFFVAIGAVTFNSIWIKSHGDPLAMERHILSLKDPIAHLSFYAFMVANGFYMDFRTGAMDAATKSQMMRRLSYQGMAVGSLASSLVSDLGHSGKMCVDYWILRHDDQNSIEACNQAWKSWTARNKFQQYFPQVIAMWASQAATEIIDSNARKFFGRRAAMESVKNFMGRKTLVNYAKKITAVDVILNVGTGGGTFAIKSIRWAGKLIQFATFVEVDHMLSPYTYRPLNNLIKPLTFDFDALAINNFWSAAEKINWDDSRLDEANKLVCSPKNPNCLESKITGEIENFSEQMQGWRDHLNSDAETDLAGWMEVTKKLLSQVDYSYKFYKSFTSSLFDTLNYGDGIASGKLENSAAEKLSLFPFRTLPFYGVGIGNYKGISGTTEDSYLTATAEMEFRQKEHIANMAQAINKVQGYLDGTSLEKFKSIQSRLASQDTNQMQAALIDINQILEINSLTDKANKKTLYSANLIAILTEFRKGLGNPMPVVYPFAGHAQAFAANSTNEMVSKEADFRLWSLSKKYMFNKESDLMTYKVFCGNEKASLDKTAVRPFGIGNEVNFLAPQFDPPSLMKKSPELDQYCNTWRKTRELKIFSENLYGQKIGDLSMYDFFLKNFNYNVIGDYRRSDNKGNFEKWWLENGRKPIDIEFKKYDEQFKKLVEISKQAIFDQKSFFNWFVDNLNHSKYLQPSLKANMQFETNFYLQIISSALNKGAAQPLSDKFTYLEKVVKGSQDDRFKSITGTEVRPEIQKVQDLLNAYYPFILQDKVNFDQYIAHSKKIDTAINDVLVAGGLKISSKSNPTEVKADLEPIDLTADEKESTTATASATGTENSSVTYQDVEGPKNLRQKTITSAVKGLRAVESEIRRFIRMKVALSQGLELDSKQFMDDFLNAKPQKTPTSGPVFASPYGQRAGV